MSGIVGQNLGRASGLIKSGGVGADSVTSASIADDAIDSEHYVNASIDNAHLADNAVGTDEIADNAVTLAKMVGGTDGNIISYDASGDPVAISTGSDGQVLTSTGAGSPPAFEASATDFDDTDLRSDIMTLALKEAITENRIAYNLPNAMIEQFQDDSKLGTETDGDRNASEYWGTSFAAYKELTLDSPEATDVTSGQSNEYDVSTGGWTDSHANDTYRGGGYGNAYATIYVDYLFNLDNDFDFKIACNNSAGAPISDDYPAYTLFWTTDTSVAAGAAPTIFRTSEDLTSSSPANFAQFSNTDVRDFWLTDAYGGTIGSDSFTVFGRTGGDANSTSGMIAAYQSNVYDNNNTPPDAPKSYWIEYVKSTATLYLRMLDDPSDETGTPAHGNYTLGTMTEMPSAGRLGFIWSGQENNEDGTSRYFSTTFASSGTSMNSITEVQSTGTLISTAQTANASQTKVSGVIIYKNSAGTATLGTDLKIYFTCNGGTNWTESTPTAAGTFSSGILMAKCPEVTCTSGTDIRYKAVWANQASGSKETQLHGIGMNY